MKKCFHMKFSSIFLLFSSVNVTPQERCKRDAFDKQFPFEFTPPQNSFLLFVLRYHTAT